MRFFILTAALIALCFLQPLPAWCMPASDAGAETAQAPEWLPWSDQVFVRAKRENKMVLLDVEAVWCHWCHVMHQTTYADPAIQKTLREHFILTRADQDAHPDISRRYEDYGWPATVFFTAEGVEITKKRGYFDPDNMKDLLARIIADPTPRSADKDGFEASEKSSMAQSDRERVLASTVYLYDKKYGGFGDQHKFIDALVLGYALAGAEAGERVPTAMAKETLEAALNLIDPVWGGIYQYSDELDWKSPHFEKIMQSQAAGLESYANGYRLFGEERFRTAARSIADYLHRFLSSPEGAFHTSQDADVNATVTGHVFYAKDDKGRRALGMPKIDQHIYSRENGLAIAAFVALYNATGDATILDQASRAAEWILKNRRLEDGGFAHGEKDAGGPYLGDTLFMGRALLALYEATGERRYLKESEAAAQFIVTRFADKEKGQAGFITAAAGASAALKPLKDTEENIYATRFFNLLHHYTGNANYRAAAENGMRYLAAPALVKSSTFQPGLLIADHEVNQPPVHLTLVGHKDDKAAQALYKTMLAAPWSYKRTEWWDKREGPMPNPDVGYPELDKPAAFVCTNRLCSRPLFEPAEVMDELKATSGIR